MKIRALQLAIFLLALAPAACTHASDDADASTTDDREAPDFVTTSAPAVPYDSAAERKRLELLVAKGNELYEEAEGIVKQTPSTRDQSTKSIERVGNAYYAEERAYKDELLEGPTSTLIRDDDLRNAEFTLRGAEPFLHAAVVESLAGCSESNARLDLKAARAILDQTQLILAGRGRDDWTPPDSVAESARDATCPSSR